MGLLVRSWNLFHGNTLPPTRVQRLEQAVRLAVRDRPDVLCLQEVPVWALDRLGAWSAMAAYGDVARRASLGPLPATPALGRIVTAVHPGLVRSTFSGQANAILLATGVQLTARYSIALNDARFRRAQARWLGLPLVARLAWARERRVCQAVAARLEDGRQVLIANLHATAYPPDQRLADAEVLRAAAFADALASPGDVCVVAGDFNVSTARSRTLGELTRPEWGFVGGAPGIDHILVRGATAGPIRRWRDARRTVDGRLLSDHAPVERRVE